MANNLVIIGAGGFGREACLLVETHNRLDKSSEKWNIIGYIDENISLKGQLLRDYPVLGGWEVTHELAANTHCICAVGNPVAKKKLVIQAKKMQLRFTSLIHPNFEGGRDVRIGLGSLISEGCIMTTNIEIGNNVSINPGCGIGHDAVIENYTTLLWRVNISGNVHVGEGCLLGTGATILQGLKIGAACTIGAGAVVTKDLPPGCTAVGIPAKIVKFA